MRIDQILETYDANYAASYNDTFLHDSWTKASVKFQLDLIAAHLTNANSWLDVACGTGYILGQFPQAVRAGLDISPSMLDHAKRQNPGVHFRHADYRDPFPEWDDAWDLVTCMWWAYCFSESMADTKRLIARLADWTSPRGTCLLPLCDPQKFDTHNIKIPYIDPKVPGRCMITAITWAWIEENGKRHDNMLSPQVDHMIAMFRQHFRSVEIVEGPLQDIGEGWRVQEVLVAKDKLPDRSAANSGDLYEPGDGGVAGQREWFFSTAPDVAAGLTYPKRTLDHVRIAIACDDLPAPSGVTAQKIGYRVEEGRRYRVSFSTRSDAPRSMAVWMSPNFGTPDPALSQTVSVQPQWQQFALTFESREHSERARVCFELGGSTTAVEIKDVQLSAVD